MGRAIRQGRVRSGGRAWRMGALAAPAALLLAWAAPAGATGSFDCSVADKTVAFEAQAVFSHGLGGSFSQFRATVGVKGKDVPPGFAALEMDGAALVHHWFHGRELRLHLYQERAEAPFGSVELVLRTRSRDRDETAFEGRYELTLSVPGTAGGKDIQRVYRGRATCSVG